MPNTNRVHQQIKTNLSISKATKLTDSPVDEYQLAVDALQLVLVEDKLVKRDILDTFTSFEISIVPIGVHALRYEMLRRINTNGYQGEQTLKNGATLATISQSIFDKIAQSVLEISANMQGSIVSRAYYPELLHTVNIFESSQARARILMPKILRYLMRHPGFQQKLQQLLVDDVAREQATLGFPPKNSFADETNNLLSENLAANSFLPPLLAYPNQPKLNWYSSPNVFMVGVPLASISILCAYVLLANRVKSFARVSYFFGNAVKTRQTSFNAKDSSYNEVIAIDKAGLDELNTTPSNKV